MAELRDGALPSAGREVRATVNGPSGRGRAGPGRARSRPGSPSRGASAGARASRSARWSFTRWRAVGSWAATEQPCTAASSACAARLPSRRSPLSEGTSPSRPPPGRSVRAAGRDRRRGLGGAASWGSTKRSGARRAADGVAIRLADFHRIDVLRTFPYRDRRCREVPLEGLERIGLLLAGRDPARNEGAHTASTGVDDPGARVADCGDGSGHAVFGWPRNRNHRCGAPGTAHRPAGRRRAWEAGHRRSAAGRPPRRPSDPEAPPPSVRRHRGPEPRERRHGPADPPGADAQRCKERVRAEPRPYLSDAYAAFEYYPARRGRGSPVETSAGRWRGPAQEGAGDLSGRRGAGGGGGDASRCPGRGCRSPCRRC